MLDLYYCALSAGRYISNNTQYQSAATPLIIKAFSFTEANKLVEDQMYNIFPPTDGWHNHKYNVQRVDLAWLEEVVESHRKSS